MIWACLVQMLIHIIISRVDVPNPKKEKKGKHTQKSGPNQGQKMGEKHQNNDNEYNDGQHKKFKGRYKGKHVDTINKATIKTTKGLAKTLMVNVMTQNMSKDFPVQH